MKTFLTELSRRNIFRVAAAYVIMGWIVLQVISVLMPALHLPDWMPSVTVTILFIGFALAMLLTWAFELTPEGVGRTQSRTGETVNGLRNLDFGLIAAALLVVLASIFISSGSPNVSATNGEGPERVSSSDAESRSGFSVAVLPFNNLSDERELGWIADGLSEDLTTRLGMASFLAVTARNSSFAYKGSSPDIRQVGKDLGVRFVVEGSIRRIGDTLRITAQLIDTHTDKHIWTDNFDHPLTRLGEMQDEVVDVISGDVAMKVLYTEIDRLKGVPNDALTISDIEAVGWGKSFIAPSPEGMIETIELMEDGLVRFPGSAVLHVELAMYYAGRGRYWEPSQREAPFSKAEHHLNEAVKAAPATEKTLWGGAWARYHMWQFDEAMAFGEEFRRLFPDSAFTNALPGVYVALGRYEEAIDEVDRWLPRAGTHHHDRDFMLGYKGNALLGLGDFVAAEAVYREALGIPRDISLQIGLIIALAGQGKLDEARVELETYRTLPGAMSLEVVADWMRLFYKDQTFAQTRIDSLKLAGME